MAWTESRAWLMEELSRTLQGQPEDGSWHAVFGSGDLAGVTFLPRRGCMLYGVSPVLAGLKSGVMRQMQDQLARAVEAHGGELDRCFAGGVAAIFPDANAALMVAMEMQARGPKLRLRIALCSGTFTSVRFLVNGRSTWTALGCAAAGASDMAASTPVGTIALDAAAYAQASDEILRVPAVVTSEYHEDALDRVNLTMVPPPGSAVSTFAGLGLPQV